MRRTLSLSQLQVYIGQRPRLPGRLQRDYVDASARSNVDYCHQENDVYDGFLCYGCS